MSMRKVRFHHLGDFLPTFKETFNLLISFTLQIVSKQLLWSHIIQRKFCEDEYTNVLDEVNRDANVTADKLERPIILSSSYTRGPRPVNESQGPTQEAEGAWKYAEHIYLRLFNDPHIFITFLSNHR